MGSSYSLPHTVPISVRVVPTEDSDTHKLVCVIDDTETIVGECSHTVQNGKIRFQVVECNLPIFMREVIKTLVEKEEFDR